MFKQWPFCSCTLGDDSLAARCLSYELSIYQIRILREQHGQWPLLKQHLGENGLNQILVLQAGFKPARESCTVHIQAKQRDSTPNKQSLSRWGVSVEEQMEKGNSVKHFQCLVCTRIHRSNKFKNMGRFGERY